MTVPLMKNKKGGVALSVILIAGFVAVEIAISTLVISYILSQQGLGLKAHNAANLVARAGLNDGIMKVIYDKEYFTASSVVTIDNYSATVIVCKDTTTLTTACDTSTPNKTEVTSYTKILGKNSKMRAILSIDSTSGLVSVDSIKEILIN